MKKIIAAHRLHLSSGQPHRYHQLETEVTGNVTLTTRVVDYEPAPTPVDAHSTPSATALRRPVTRRALPPAAPSPPVVEPAVPAAAHAFADAALRSVLEVLDRRRPIAQLRPLMPQAMVDVVAALAPSTRQVRSAALLQRVRLRAAGAVTDPPRAAEVFATYARGNRVGAIAARVELLPTATGVRWQLVALHLG